MYRDFVPVNNDICLVVLDNAMHYLDDVQPTMKQKQISNMNHSNMRFFTGGIGRRSLWIFVAPGGPKYSAGKAV
jgi:hypothetical protein